MPKIKITDRAIDRLKAPAPTGRQTLYWDAELRGFGVLVSGVSSSKTYVVQRDVGGRTRRVTIAPTNVIGIAEARRRAELILADFYRGIDPKADRRGADTLRSVLEAYLAARKGLRPKSVHVIRDAVERHLEPWCDWPLCDITPELVEARHRLLQKQIAARGRYMGYATANDAMRTLGTLWSFAADRIPNLPANPVRRLRRQWFPVRRRDRIIHPDELAVFHRAVLALPNAVQRDYLRLLLFTGLRRTEAASLTWSDVDLAQRVIRIRAARTKSGRKLDLPMTDYVHAMLSVRRRLGDTGFVFPANSGAGHISEPKFPLAAVERATGIKASAHDLRRSYVTVAESCDISPLALRALINHSLGGDVTSGYVIMSVERLREPAQRVADRLKELCAVETVAAEN
jgi:integrase